MQIRTTHFGPVDVAASDVFYFPGGMIGFEDYQQWILLADVANPLVGWLQSAFQESTALPVISPRRFMPDYRIHLRHEQWKQLHAGQNDQLVVLNVVARNGGVFTANLKAPVIINLDRRVGCQVVVSEDYPLQHPLAAPAQRLRKSA